MALKSAQQQKATSLLPSDNSTLIRSDRFALGFTQSEISTHDDCAEKWYLGYNHLLRKRGSWADYFVYGDAIHETLKHYYSTGEEQIATLQLPDDVIVTGEVAAKLEYMQAIVNVMMERYFHFYKDDLKIMEISLCEEVVEFEFEGLKLLARIDLLFQTIGDPTYILSDHKSSAREESYSFAGYQFRFQFMFYFWIVQKAYEIQIDKFLVNHIKKPALRQGKNESLQAFIARVRADMVQVPEKYFQRTWLPMIKGSMEHFEQRVLRPKIERLKLLTQATTPASIVEVIARNQNTGACTQYGHCCPFMQICQDGFKRAGHQYVTRENKHEELVD